MKGGYTNRAICLMTAMALAMSDNKCYLTDSECNEEIRQRKQHIQEKALCNAKIKQQFREHPFTIQGKTVLAKSRKDAIKILKHKGLLK